MTVDPQHTNQAIDTMSAITVTHIVLMGVLAALALAAIWWGATLARRRKDARKQVDENFATAEKHGAVTQPTASIDDATTLSADVPAGEVAPRTGTPAADVPVPVATPIAGDLTQIKGLGPKLATTLAEHGITRVDQIAALTPEAAADLDARLGTFQGRMARDRWIEQARLLSAGDRAGYEAAFGKLGG